MGDVLAVHEVYLSVQGESTWAGCPCIFIRLTGCNLRCSYCDTAYAFTGGRRREVRELLTEVEALAAPFGGCEVRGVKLPLVEVTGGEPLVQPGSVGLLHALAERGYQVLLETSGALDIVAVDPRVCRIMDLKCPGSGECERNRWENLAHLKPTDEVKFVVGYVEDYDWMKSVITRHRLWERCSLLVSWAAPLAPHQRDGSLKPPPEGLTAISCRELAERVVRDALPVRFQLQLHKYIWPSDARGV